MDVSGISASGFDAIEKDEDEQIGKLGKRCVAQSHKDGEIPFLPFEKKCSALWFRPETVLAMTGCSRMELEVKADTPIGTFEGKLVVYGDIERQSFDNENKADTDRDNKPDSMDRDFDRNEIDRG